MTLLDTDLRSLLRLCKWVDSIDDDFQKNILLLSIPIAADLCNYPLLNKSLMDCLTRTVELMELGETARETKDSMATFSSLVGEREVVIANYNVLRRLLAPDNTHLNLSFTNASMMLI